MIDVQVGSYRIVQWLAKGGMGEVYLARHEIMDRGVVVKVLHPDLSQNKDQVARFFNEARAATSIQHPGIVDVFDVGYADGRAYIVMEHLRGETLATRLERERFELEHALVITRQLLGALRAAHERGIVHRDLKPENVYVVPDPDVPGGERVKIIDFGVAKLAQEPTSSMTARGSIFGTPAYMAPEQCTDSAAVDHRADLYALGCILYELLCGTPPFGKGGLELLAAHLRDQPPALRSHDATIPDDIEAIALRLLAKDPDARFPSCEVIIEAIEQTEAFGGWITERMSRPTLPPIASSTIPPAAQHARTQQDLAYAATMASLPESEASSGGDPDAHGTRANGRASTATTFFSAGQVRGGHTDARKRWPTRRTTGLAALVLLAGGALVGMSTGGDGKGDGPAMLPRAPLVVIESPPDAAPAPAPETELLDQARLAFDEQRWEDAVHSAREVIDTLAEQPETEAREQARTLAQTLQEQARNEQRNQWTYESFLQALSKDDIRGVVHGYEQIPRSSVYRGRAMARYRRAREAWLEPKLARASAHALKQQCERIDALELEVGFLFPESVEQIRGIAAKCRGGLPSAEAELATVEVAARSMTDDAAAAASGEPEKSPRRARLERKRALARFLDKARQPLEECATHNSVTGAVFLRFRISPQGEAEDISTSSDSAAFQECVQRVIGWRKFPRSSETTEVKRKLRFER